MGELQQALPRFEKAGATVVAVSVDTNDDLETLRDELNLTFRLLSDTKLKIAAAYGVRHEEGDEALPATFVIAPDREILHVMVGKDAADRPAIDEVLALVGAD